MYICGGLIKFVSLFTATDWHGSWEYEDGMNHFIGNFSHKDHHPCLILRQTCMGGGPFQTELTTPCKKAFRTAKWVGWGCAFGMGLLHGSVSRGMHIFINAPIYVQRHMHLFIDAHASIYR